MRGVTAGCPDTRKHRQRFMRGVATPVMGLSRTCHEACQGPFTTHFTCLSRPRHMPVTTLVTGLSRPGPVTTPSQACHDPVTGMTRPLSHACHDPRHRPVTNGLSRPSNRNVTTLVTGLTRPTSQACHDPVTGLSRPLHRPVTTPVMGKSRTLAWASHDPCHGPVTTSVVGQSKDTAPRERTRQDSDARSGTAPSSGHQAPGGALPRAARKGPNLSASRCSAMLSRRLVCSGGIASTAPRARIWTVGGSAPPKRRNC